MLCTVLRNYYYASINDPKEMPIPVVQATSTVQNARAVYMHVPTMIGNLTIFENSYQALHVTNSEFGN